MSRAMMLAAAAVLALSTQASADKKPKSPPAETSATIGGKSVKIAYHAPSARGRKIFGDLVPHGKVWRTGANQATTLTTEGDIQIKDLKISKGSYSLFTIPTEGGLTLIVNKQTGQWGTKHDEKQDLGRVQMEVGKPEKPVEALEIKLSGEGDAGKLSIAWENLSASVPLSAAK